MIAHESVIIDNSFEEPLVLFELGKTFLVKDYDADFLLHRRLLAIVESALGIRI